ncbi:hypothetical protein C357_05548 [Citreicella sp. 357]|nr:hypothetical protein C357_05548 [Citreicella sp. 357]
MSMVMANIDRLTGPCGLRPWTGADLFGLLDMERRSGFVM